MRLIVIILLGIFINGAVALAFVKSSEIPPAGNTPPPLNVGPATQSKAGDLEVENLIIKDGLELGGEQKSSWPDLSGSCSWEGLKCACASDDSSVGNVVITLGVDCRAGQIKNFQITQFDISSKNKKCLASAPAGCEPGLYSYIGGTGEESGFLSTIKGTITTVTSVVVSTVNSTIKTINKIWKKWF